MTFQEFAIFVYNFDFRYLGFVVGRLIFDVYDLGVYIDEGITRNEWRTFFEFLCMLMIATEGFSWNSRCVRGCNCND